MMKFPKTIYVKVEPATSHADGEWLNILEDGPDDTSFDENTKVAVYQLVEVGKVEVTRKYVAPKRGARAR